MKIKILYHVYDKNPISLYMICVYTEADFHLTVQPVFTVFIVFKPVNTAPHEDLKVFHSTTMLQSGPCTLLEEEDMSFGRQT